MVEPFGEGLRRAIGNDAIADKFIFQELYDSTKTIAKQIAEKNKYTISGQYQASSAGEIQLGASNIPEGSVVVTAGGSILTENVDYTVDYSMGTVKIINQSIIDAGTPVNVSLESNTDYGMVRKTMFGLNWQYDFRRTSKSEELSCTLASNPLPPKSLWAANRSTTRYGDSTCRGSNKASGSRTCSTSFLCFIVQHHQQSTSQVRSHSS